MSVQHKTEETAEGCAEAEMQEKPEYNGKNIIQVTANRKVAGEGNKYSLPEHTKLKTVKGNAGLDYL